jgi:thiol-disulfide isomerase/thioredoxin
MFFLAGIAQQDTTPLFKRFSSVPPISLLKSDSSLITKDGLKKNRPVMLMYFSPECHHCQHQMEDLIKRMDDLKKIEIVLATYQPMEELISFQEKYRLNEYPNIQAGRDTRFFIVPFFKIRNLPYLALYDKKGNLIKTYEGNVKVDTLIQTFK